MSTHLTSHYGSTSLGLLDRVKSRDPDAWRKLSDLYAPLIYYWCRRAGLQPDAAADVFQDVFTTLVGAISGFQKVKPEHRFRGWLWTITRHKIIDALRRARREPNAAGGTGCLEQVAVVLPEDPDEFTPVGETSDVFRRAVAQVRGEFADKTWDAFWRSAINEEDTAAIAADLGVTPNAIRQSKSRVLRRLREEFGELLN
jgi:RNA polymerase sigma-70 factor (ECF subfamily)